MMPSPFVLPDKFFQIDRQRRTAPSLSVWRRFVDKFLAKHSASLSTEMVIDVLSKIDFPNRFNSREKVLNALRQFTPIHGGVAALRQLEKVKSAVAEADPLPIYRCLLKTVEPHPEQIIRWVKQTTLHVSMWPAVMPNEKSARAFTPLETLITGIGQCTGFANLAAALIEAAGFEVRMWATPCHSFLEWRPRGGRWQLEDPAVFPPDVQLPRGLSMRSLLESFLDWRSIMSVMPTLNIYAQPHCFVPTNNGPIICWHDELGDPSKRTFLHELRVGSIPLQFRNIIYQVVREPDRNALRVTNNNPEPLILLICEGAIDTSRTSMDERRNQEDVFRLARARELYQTEIRSANNRLYVLIPGAGKTRNVEIPNAFRCVTLFTVAVDNVNAHPFPLRDPIHLPPSDAGLKSTTTKFPLSTDLGFAEMTFGAVVQNDSEEIATTVAAEINAENPRQAAAILDKLQLPPFRGRVLVAVGDAGGFALALARHAESVAAVDTCDDRLWSLASALDRMSPRPAVEPTHGSVEELPFGEGTIDAIFCRDAACQFDMSRALAEFHRVSRVGGHVYIGCHADAWYQHLMLCQGDADPVALRCGRDALYNAAWRRCAAESLAPLRKSVARRGLRLADPAGVDVETLLDEMDRHLRDMSPDDAATVRRLELRVRDACGDGHLATVLADILANAAGMRQGPTVAAADQAWQPEEVAELAVAAGFSGFTWWSAAGSRQTPGLRPLEIGPMLETPATARRHFRGALTVWHCLFTKA